MVSLADAAPTAREPDAASDPQSARRRPLRATVRTFRYVRTWLGGKSAVRETELAMEREGGAVPARLVLPSGRPPHPAWILLHGVTRPGIHHPQLVRFSRALATSGAAVVVPEVPEWKDLRLAPEAAFPSVSGAIRLLDALPEVRGDRYGLIGFSFGGPHALVAATRGEIAPRLAGVVSFGGYCDLERTVWFQFTGEHEWRGHVHHVPPDPYGRWVVGANFLTRAPGYRDAGDVARALWELAAHAAERRSPAWSPEYDPVKLRLREAVAAPHREIFDAFAPPAERDPDRTQVDALVEALVAGGKVVAPLMEPGRLLGQVGQPVELLHGRGDRLIPYTESIRLARSLGSGARLTVTRLFAHTTEERFPRMRGVSEVWTFLRALQRVIDTV